MVSQARPGVSGAPPTNRSASTMRGSGGGAVGSAGAVSLAAPAACLPAAAGVPVTRAAAPAAGGCATGRHPAAREGGATVTPLQAQPVPGRPQAAAPLQRGTGAADGASDWLCINTMRALAMD